MMTRRTVIAGLAGLQGCVAKAAIVPVELSGPDSETRVLDGWTVVMTRCERLRDIIKSSYLHREQDRAQIARVREHLAEINAYMNRIDELVKW